MKIYYSILMTPDEKTEYYKLLRTIRQNGELVTDGTYNVGGILYRINEDTENGIQDNIDILYTV